MKSLLAGLITVLCFSLNVEAKPKNGTEPAKKAESGVQKKKPSAKKTIQKPAKNDSKKQAKKDEQGKLVDIDGFMIAGNKLEYELTLTESTSEDHSSDPSWKVIEEDEIKMYERTIVQKIACGVEKVEEKGNPKSKDYRKIARITCDEHEILPIDLNDLVVGCWALGQDEVYYDRDCASFNGKDLILPLFWKEKEICPELKDQCEFHTKQYAVQKGLWCVESESLIGDGYKTKDCASAINGITVRERFTEGKTSYQAKIKLLNPIVKE